MINTCDFVLQSLPLSSEWKMICPYHQSEYSKYVCLENSCEKKIICQKCLDKIENINQHKLISIQEFFKGVSNFVEMPDNIEQFQTSILQIIEGESLIKKKEFYLQQAETVKEQLRAEHINNIKMQMDRFKSEVENQIKLTKDHIIESYENKLQEFFSNQSLKSKQYKDRGCKIILSSLKSFKTSEINNNLVKLHQGKYEICFAKDSMYTIYSELTSKMENMINQNLHQIKEHMIEFSNFFHKNYDVKKSIINDLKKGLNPQQQKISVSMLKSNSQNIFTSPLQPLEISQQEQLSFSTSVQNSSQLKNNFSNMKTIQNSKNTTPKNFIIKQIQNHDINDNNILEQNNFIPKDIRLKQQSFDLRNIRNKINDLDLSQTLSPQQNIYQTSIFSQFINRDKRHSADQTTEADYLRNSISDRATTTSSNNKSKNKTDRNTLSNFYLPSKYTHNNDIKQNDSSQSPYFISSSSKSNNTNNKSNNQFKSSQYKFA